jgi:hypothetical protein
MFGLVARLCEIQVVRQEVFLIGGSQANLQVEFTPSFLGDSEWRVLESCLFDALRVSLDSSIVPLPL